MRKFVLAVAAFLSFTHVSRAQTVVFTGATIIDGNGGAPIHDGVIIINDKRIMSVGPKSSVVTPGGRYGSISSRPSTYTWPSSRTGLKIAGKDIARPDSMIAAINLAAELA